MKTKKSTDELIKVLAGVKDIKGFLSGNIVDIPSYSFEEYLENLIYAKGLKKGEVIKNSGIEKAYFYQILKGRKNPSRNKVLSIALGMELSLDETRRMLKIASCGDLYSKNERDCVIIYCILNGKSVIETNILLDEIGEEILS